MSKFLLLDLDILFIWQWTKYQLWIFYFRYTVNDLKATYIKIKINTIQKPLNKTKVLLSANINTLFLEPFTTDTWEFTDSN